MFPPHDTGHRPAAVSTRVALPPRRPDCTELLLTVSLPIADRPLQHINKKGRPVSQCQHCRAMRKSRSSHVKCDCGEKTSKCAHLQPTVEGHTGELALSRIMTPSHARDPF